MAGGRPRRRLRAAGVPLGRGNITEHEAIAGTQAAIWYLTNGHPDAEPPANLTGAERQAAYRERRGLALAVKRRSKPASPWSAFL